VRAGQSERYLHDCRVKERPNSHSAVVVQQKRRQLEQTERQPAAYLALPVELDVRDLLSVDAHVFLSD
jgi:hypothetical protein